MAPAGLGYLRDESSGAKYCVRLLFTASAADTNPKSLSLSLPPHATACALLRKAADALELAPKEARRLRGSYRRQDFFGGTMRDYGIVDGSTVSLTIGLPPAIRICDVGKGVVLAEGHEDEIVVDGESRATSPRPRVRGRRPPPAPSQQGTIQSVDELVGGEVVLADGSVFENPSRLDEDDDDEEGSEGSRRAVKDAAREAADQARLIG